MKISRNKKFKTSTSSIFILAVLLLFSSALLAQPSPLPRYNQVFSIATHNSYWVKRTPTVEPFASGTQERLMDQLLFEQARALEIDIHKIPGKKGQWAIYHTGRRKNVLFATLPDFLKQLQQFNYAVPQHEVVTVVFELKEILKKNFDPTHTPADLDSLLEKYLGTSLFRPRDLMKRCPGADNLCDCIKSSSEIWPTIEELRGKFIFVVLGNFHFGIIGHGGLGWAVYGSSKNPSAFPMFSDFSVFNKPGKAAEKIPEEMLKRAYNTSVFQQVEILNDTNHLKNVARFIAQGGIVRGENSFSIEQQEMRIKAGFQFLQTDYPWIHYKGKGFSQPYQPIHSEMFKDTSAFTEPGHRIYISPSDESFWNRMVSETKTDWETLPSTTRSSPDSNYPNSRAVYGKGCLRAEGDSQNSISICRKVDHWQNAIITVETSRSGVKNVLSFVTNDRTCGVVGDYIKMSVKNNANGKESSVMVYSSSQMMNSKTPQWNLLATEYFETPLTRQGIFAGEGDVLFVGTKMNGKYVAESAFTRKEK